jgi:hypothetical protein
MIPASRRSAAAQRLFDFSAAELDIAQMKSKAGAILIPMIDYCRVRRRRSRNFAMTAARKRASVERQRLMCHNLANSV